MLEKLERKITKLEIERQANYEGNHTLLFLDRISNPTIRKRMIDDLYHHHTSANNLEDNTDLSREEFEKEVDEAIEKTKSHTNIEYSEKPEIDTGGRQDFGVGLVFIGGINPDTGKAYSAKALSIIEAHEKGHEIRNFGPFESDFTRKVISCFDFESVKPSEKFIDFVKRVLEEDGEIENYKTDIDLQNKIKEYFFSVKELYERMSQLKNYFGMKGNEVFTKEHLDYARKHYSLDTGHISQIQMFFDAITPEKEKKFIELMNTLGV